MVALPSMKLPTGFPPISAAALLPDGTIITGHKNGYVARWKQGTSAPEILVRASSEVHSVEAGAEDVYVGCSGGDLYWVAKTGAVETVISPTGSKYGRVFRLLELRRGVIAYTSTYGVVKVLHRTSSGEWMPRQLNGHSDAVFAIASSPNGLVATGDYRGTIILWREGAKGVFAQAAQLGIPSYCAGLAFVDNDLLAAVGKNGVQYLFEHGGGGVWRRVFESEAASGIGRSVARAPDSKRIIAATAREVIEIDSASQMVKTYPIEDAVVAFAKTDGVVVVTSGGFQTIAWSEFTVQKDVVEYAYLKVSMLGNTGYGKTTLSSALATGVSGKHQSTFGRKIWTWKVGGEEPRRILLSDNGGQEQVIGTLLPLSADSDVVLFFFKQTELAGLETALELHDRVRPMLSATARTYLLETYIDQQMKAVTDERTRRAVAENGLDGIFKVSATSEQSVEEFRQRFLATLDWKAARKAIQSQALASLIEVVDRLKLAGKHVLTVKEIQSAYEEATKRTIYLYHLRFLLGSLTDSGAVEYYQAVGETVVLDDPMFNKLRTEIPILARDFGGMVDWTKIEQRFAEHDLYVKMLDRYYLLNGISLDVGHDDQRLFPAFLEKKNVKVPPKIVTVFSQTGGAFNERHYALRETRTSNLLEALFDIQLDALQITALEGLLAWGENAYVFYALAPFQNAMEGPKLRISFIVAGTDKDACTRLTAEFERILDTLYGPVPSGG